MAVLPSGVLAVGSGTAVKILSIRSGRLIKILRGHSNVVIYLALRGAVLASGCHAGVLRIWDVQMAITASLAANKAVLRAIGTNCSVTRLDCSHVSLDDECFEAIAMALWNNPAITELELDDGYIADMHCVQRIRAILACNQAIRDAKILAQKTDLEALELFFLRNAVLQEQLYTPLHMAVMADNESLVQTILKQNGEWVYAKNMRGQTPINLSQIYAQRVISDLLAKEERFQQLIKESAGRRLGQGTFKEQQIVLHQQLRAISESDVIGVAIRELWQHLKAGQSEFSSELHSRLSELFSKLEYPQRLIPRADNLRGKHVKQSALVRGELRPQHTFFSRIHEMLKRIEEVEVILPDNSNATKIKAGLGLFKACCHGYIDTLCQATPPDRERLYQIPTLLHITGQPPRRLSEEAKCALALKFVDGREVGDTSAGSHIVKIYAGIHFKKNPHAPGVEYMVSSLGEIIAGRIAAPTELVKVIDEQGVHSCFLASKTVVGTELQYVIERHPYSLGLITSENFSAMMILGLLTDPQDGKPDNYMVELKVDEGARIKQLEIIGIDNDMAFADPVVLEHDGPKKGQHFINVKNVLNFFPQMKSPIDPTFRRTFLGRLLEKVIIDLLKSLYYKNQGYQALLDQGIFSEEEFSGGKTSRRGLQLPIKLVPGTVDKLYHKMLQIRVYLLEHPTATHADLFRHIEPIVARYYERIQEDVEHKEQHTLIAETVMACVRRLYEETAPTVEEEVSLKRRVRVKAALMTELVLETAERFGFEEGRSELPEQAIKGFLFSLDYSRFDESVIAQLYESLGDPCFIGFDYRDANVFLRVAICHKVNNSSLFKYCISRGVDLNIIYPGEGGLLHLCAMHKHVKAAKYLLKHGAKISVTNDAGYTVLHIAASANNAKMIRLLVSHGIDIDAQEKHGETALDKALNRGNMKAAKVLVQLGCRILSDRHIESLPKLQKWSSESQQKLSGKASAADRCPANGKKGRSKDPLAKKRRSMKKQAQHLDADHSITTDDKSASAESAASEWMVSAEEQDVLLEEAQAQTLWKSTLPPSTDRACFQANRSTFFAAHREAQEILREPSPTAIPAEASDQDAIKQPH